MLLYLVVVLDRDQSYPAGAGVPPTWSSCVPYQYSGQYWYLSVQLAGTLQLSYFKSTAHHASARH